MHARSCDRFPIGDVEGDIHEFSLMWSGSGWFSGCSKSWTEGAMGTVGLNFGAATSGTGFDVSSTVAEIVGNLQNVETPWNTQLTTLESQDTAISSLGTLFSNSPMT